MTPAGNLTAVINAPRLRTGEAAPLGAVARRAGSDGVLAHEALHGGGKQQKVEKRTSAVMIRVSGMSTGHASLIAKKVAAPSSQSGAGGRRSEIAATAICSRRKRRVPVYESRIV